MKKKNENLAMVKLRNFVKKNVLTLSFLLVVVLIGLMMVATTSNTGKELVYGDDVIDLHFFHLSTCPHCHRQIAFHKILMEMYPTLRINEYEITSAEAKAKFVEFASAHPEVDQERISTPTTFIGKNYNIGYGTDEVTGQRLIEMIDEEKERIEANWDETKIRTDDLRAQLQE